MKRIVSVSLGSSAADYEFTTAFLGHEFHIRRVGADWDVSRTEALLRKHDGEADAIGLGMVQDHATVGTRRFHDRLTTRLEQAVTRTAVTTGNTLRTFFDEWAVRHVQQEEGHYFSNARVLFLSGISNYRIASILSEYTRNLRFADPVTLDGVPKVLGSLRLLEGVRGRDGAGPASDGRRGRWRRTARRRPRGTARRSAARWRGRIFSSRPTRKWRSDSHEELHRQGASSPRRSPTTRWRGWGPRACTSSSIGRRSCSTASSA